MEIIDFKRKWICIFLIFSMIFQSCSVYKSESGTFDEAIASKSKVKVTTRYGHKEIIKKIEKIDGVYYGEVKTEGEYVRTPLYEEDYYEKIRLKNKPLSIFLTAVTIAIPVAMIIAASQIDVM